MAVTLILLLAGSGVVSPDKLFTKLLAKSFPAPSLLAIQIPAWEYNFLDRRNLAMGYINHTIPSFFCAQMIISTVFPNTSVKSRTLKPVSHWQGTSNNIQNTIYNLKDLNDTSSCYYPGQAKAACSPRKALDRPAGLFSSFQPGNAGKTGLMEENQQLSGAEKVQRTVGIYLTLHHADAALMKL